MRLKKDMDERLETWAKIDEVISPKQKPLRDKIYEMEARERAAKNADDVGASENTLQTESAEETVETFDINPKIALKSPETARKRKGFFSRIFKR
jgi:hypothetical protein